MAMATKGTAKSFSDPNITPFIDVLLVLLVIFMITQPLMRKVLDIQVPVEEESQATQQQANQIVLEIKADGSFAVNTQVVPEDQLFAFLKAVYDPRPDKLIFIKAHDSRRYREVIRAVDVARAAGVKVFGLAPGDIATGATP